MGRVGLFTACRPSVTQFTVNDWDTQNLGSSVNRITNSENIDD